jgi:tetratricopeptide (TPR) repeat protein
MANKLNPGEEAQLLQTIEMFEVIVQSQTDDTQSLEILKEAYTKLGREAELINTSKRIAQAYLQHGQLSSAILEYETILQRKPNDEDVRNALKLIEDKANNAVAQPPPDPTVLPSVSETTLLRRQGKTTVSAAPSSVDDGRKSLQKVFVESKIISAGDFELCHPLVDLATPPTDVVEPFIQKLHDKGILPLEKSLKLLSDKSRMAYLPLDRYDSDMDLARGFPVEVCRRWCVLPFDRMSKSILVATSNPFNQQAAKELAEATTHRMLWYVASPVEIIANLRKAFR